MQKLAFALAASLIVVPAPARGPGGVPGRGLTHGGPEHRAQGKLEHQALGRQAHQLKHRGGLKHKRPNARPGTPGALPAPPGLPRPPAPADLPRPPSPPRPSLPPPPLPGRP